MTPTGAEIVLLATLGALLALDQDAGLGLQLSQPLIASALAGWILGRFDAGIAVGGTMQLLWMTLRPVGGARLPDLALASVAAVLALPATWRSVPLLEQDQLAAPMVVGILAGWGGSALLGAQRRLHALMVRRRAAALEAGEARSLAAIQHEALALHGLRGILGVLLLVALAPALGHLLQQVGVRTSVVRFAAGLAVVALLRLAGGRWKRLALVGLVIGFLPAVF